MKGIYFVKIQGKVHVYAPKLYIEVSRQLECIEVYGGHFDHLRGQASPPLTLRRISLTFKLGN